MARLEDGQRLNRDKAPKLAYARPKLKDRINGFARRIRIIRKSKTIEERHALFREMQSAIREDKEAFARSVADFVSQKSRRIHGSAPVDAMFGFLKGMKRGVIQKTEESIALERETRSFSNKLAFELEKANISPDKEQEKRTYILIDLLMNEGNPKPNESVGQSLLKEKREIDQKLTDFIDEQAKKE